MRGSIRADRVGLARPPPPLLDPALSTASDEINEISPAPLKRPLGSMHACPGPPSTLGPNIDDPPADYRAEVLTFATSVTPPSWPISALRIVSLPVRVKSPPQWVMGLSTSFVHTRSSPIPGVGMGEAGAPPR